MQESSVVSMGSGYPAVVQRAPQIVISLRAPVEPGAHMEPSGIDPNEKSNILTLQMMRAPTLILGFVRLDNQNRNLEPNLWYMLPGMILGTARTQL